MIIDCGQCLARNSTPRYHHEIEELRHIKNANSIWNITNLSYPVLENAGNIFDLIEQIKRRK